MFFAVSCSEQNTTQPVPDPDSDLKSEIVGTWSRDFLVISYNNNNEFQRTQTYTFADTSLTQQEVIKGTYDIKNGILLYDVSEWYGYPYLLFNSNSETTGHKGFINKIQNRYQYGQSAVGYSPIISMPQYKIQIDSDLLYFYPVDILVSTSGDPSDIWGEWTTSQWALGNSSENPDSVILGKLEWKYIFDKDAETLTHGFRFPANSGGLYTLRTDTITYSPPDLSWGNYAHRKIEFHEGKMYMFYVLSEIPAPYVRMK